MSRLIYILYILLQIIPIIFIESYQTDLWHQNIAGRNLPITLLLCLIPLLLIAELNFFHALLSLWDFYKKSIQRMFKSFLAVYLINIIIFIFIGTYYLIIAKSWLFRLNGFYFITWSDLWKVFFLFDVRNTIRLASNLEIYSILVIITFSIFMTIFVALTRQRTDSLKDIRTALTRFIVTLLVPCVILITLFYSYTHEGRDTFLPIAKNQLFPQYSLFIIESENEIPVSLNIQQLQPAEDLNAYTQLVKNVASLPNIIIITIEALRADVLEETFNDKSIMPNLIWMSENGVKFERAVAQSPETDYSQTTIYTGQFPLRSSVRDLHADTSYPHILLYDLLAKIGYQTALLTNEWSYTKRLTNSHYLDLHFDPEFPEKFQSLDLLPNWFDLNRPTHTYHPLEHDQLKIDIFNSWLSSIEKNERPFFTSIFFYSSHFPYDLLTNSNSTQDLQLNESVSFFNHSLQSSKILKKRYYKTLENIDRLIGILLQDLKSKNLMDNTIIVVTGDHGELFKEYGEVTHGGRLRPKVLHVPLVFFAPNLLKPIKDSEITVGHVDIAPTILSLLGLPSITYHQGRAVLGDFSEPIEVLKNRRLFAVTQSSFYEDAIIIWPNMLVNDLRTNKVRIEIFDTAEYEAIDEQVKESLMTQLTNFRKKQLQYYELDSDIRNKFSPPQFE